MFKSKQMGVISSLLVSAVAIVVVLWVGSQQQELISIFKSKQIDQRFLAMKLAKQRLMQFAVLQPEIYQTNSDSTLRPAGKMPSLGYFPCPDLDGDGLLLNTESSCGNPYDSLAPNPDATGFVPDPELSSGGENCDGTSPCMGFLPSQFKSRFVYFGKPAKYYLVVDERFAYQSAYYNTGSSQYFTPLSVDTIESASTPLGLSLDNTDGYIALLIDAGNNGLSPENQDGDRFFISPSAPVALSQSNDDSDLIVGITWEEWKLLIARRLCIEAMRWKGEGEFTGLSTEQHWAKSFNDSDPTLPEYNPFGSGVESWVSSCTFK
ncbi:hypothetical protein [Thiomicrorhabdus indica]|uniref:hypothetical protein n=1 Tax=Thiomicrorhabdus indica TaxID=2267253 RepID=UPI002AA6698C|nr:hypothetical protein [Thiomicrorhabdus indica]